MGVSQWLVWSNSVVNPLGNGIFCSLYHCQMVTQNTTVTDAHSKYGKCEGQY